MPLSEAHSEPVHALYSDHEVARRLLHVAIPFTREDARAFCTAPVSATQQHRFAATLEGDGSFVGVGVVRDLVRELGFASIGYSLLRSHWGHGYAARIAGELVALARRELGASEVRAGVRPDNAASIRVLEKLGVARLEPATEVLYYARALGPTQV